MEAPGNDNSSSLERPAYRTPLGMPIRADARREGAIISFVIHVGVILLLLFPVIIARTVITQIQQGAGGTGPAGGGGGGRAGEEGYHETLRFVRVVPQQVPTPTVIPPIPTPVVPKIPPPQVKPPVQTVPEQQVSALPVVANITAMAGVGNGRDGTAGSGLGSGGGVGSGEGTGRGSGTGPGTGGGTATNYPPSPKELFLPPMPAPASVRGTKTLAEFDVDSTGKVLAVHFDETRDGNYNRRLESVLRLMKFKPGTRPDGTPIRMKYQMGIEF